MKLGVMNNPRRKLLSEIEWIGANGFDFIDLTVEEPGASPERTDWTVVTAAIQDAGLGVVCHAAPYFPIDNPSSRVRQAALDELRRCIDVAKLIGASICTTHFLGWPSYMPEAEGYE
ncbi:MAG: TIM barrel protein, partial [Caldilineaceae bacterium]|nr:TIM barrel protein [Caldilineaceae bacterium]